MFEWINMGSKIVNMVEVCCGVFVGLFMDFIIEFLVFLKFVVFVFVFKKDLDECEYEEFVVCFFVYSDGLEGYKDCFLEFIFNYVKKMNVEVVNDLVLIDCYCVWF